MHDDGSEIHMRRAVLPKEARWANQVIIKKEHQVATRRGDAGISGGGRAAVWLLEDAQRAPWCQTAQHLGCAVGRAIHDDNELIILRREILCQERGRRAFQRPPAIERRNDH
jgi:hypothetical protein